MSKICTDRHKMKEVSERVIAFSAVNLVKVQHIKDLQAWV